MQVCSCRPGYESVQTAPRNPYPSSLQQRPSSGTHSPITVGGVTAGSATPPLIHSTTSGGRVGTPRLSRVPSTRGSPTQEQLTTNSSSTHQHHHVNGVGSSSPPRTGHSPTQVGGDLSGGEAGRVGSAGVIRTHSITRSRPPGGGGGGGRTPLTRQQLYRSRNFLHHDLQLPDGYGE